MRHDLEDTAKLLQAVARLWPLGLVGILEEVGVGNRIRLKPLKRRLTTAQKRRRLERIAKRLRRKLGVE